MLLCQALYSEVGQGSESGLWVRNLCPKLYYLRIYQHWEHRHLGVVAHTCSPSTQETEVGRPGSRRLCCPTVTRETYFRYTNGLGHSMKLKFGIQKQNYQATLSPTGGKCPDSSLCRTQSCPRETPRASGNPWASVELGGWTAPGSLLDGRRLRPRVQGDGAG